jgi:hypothetical protein
MFKQQIKHVRAVVFAVVGAATAGIIMASSVLAGSGGGPFPK